MTPIGNLRKLKKNLCNHFLKSVQSGERVEFLHGSPNSADQDKFKLTLFGGIFNIKTPKFKRIP